MSLIVSEYWTLIGADKARVLQKKKLDQGVRPEAYTSPSATKKGCSDKSFCM